MTDNEPKYYDPETGKPTLAATDAVLKCTHTPMRDRANVADAVSELARLERERDEARANADKATYFKDNACELLATERSATERAETERAETIAILRTELRQARRRELVLDKGVVPQAFFDLGAFGLDWGRADRSIHPIMLRCVIDGWHMPFPTATDALDAAWAALHAAGLVEDEDAE